MVLGTNTYYNILHVKGKRKWGVRRGRSARGVNWASSRWMNRRGSCCALPVDLWQMRCTWCTMNKGLGRGCSWETKVQAEGVSLQIHTYIHTYAHAHMYAHTRSLARLHARTHAHARTHFYTHTHTHTHTHTCKHTHTHTHTRKHT